MGNLVVSAWEDPSPEQSQNELEGFQFPAVWEVEEEGGKDSDAKIDEHLNTGGFSV